MQSEKPKPFSYPDAENAAGVLRAKPEVIKAWHFLHEDKRLRYGDGRIVQAGRTYKYKGDEPIEPCEAGMHASIRAIDALHFAPGPIICRVEISGGVLYGTDKIVGMNRNVLWMADATKTLHTFACRVAEDALNAAGVTDERCWAAISTKLRWLAGKATDDELAAAWAAAGAAAWAAAGAAARSAAWAAWAAGNDARSAAWAARAAGDAARAAGDAAWAAQNEWLESMLMQLGPALAAKGEG